MISMADVKNTDTIGMNIKRYRKEAGMTQGDLADITFIQRPTISKYEKGKLMPTVDNLISIEKALKLKEGTLVQKVAIAIPDTSALMRNKRLLNLLLEDYSQIVISDIVISRDSYWRKYLYVLTQLYAHPALRVIPSPS